jgi:hypothetical protein
MTPAATAFTAIIKHKHASVAHHLPSCLVLWLRHNLLQLLAAGPLLALATRCRLTRCGLVAGL